MQLSAQELAGLSERASSLGERLRDGWIASAEQNADAVRRLTRWRHLAGEDQPRQLAAMLRPLGIEAMPDPELLKLLGPGRYAADSSPPEWTSLLNKIVAHVSRTFIDHAGPDPVQSPGGIPYEHLYWPVAAFAWQSITERLSTRFLVGTKVRHSLQRHLVRRIANVASIAVHPLFLAHRSLAASGMMQILFGGGPPGDLSSGAARLYAGFVAEQREDGLRTLFVRLPVVARLVATVTRFWIDFIGEFLHRLQTDRDELKAWFGVWAAPEYMRPVKVGISDPHDGGRSVLILEFTGGRRLVYKPRPLAIDQAFYHLVERINERIPDPGLGVLKVLDRGAYGWMEFARHTPCSNRQAARRYYWRAGFLVHLAHWLRGIDFHRENVVAAGEHPMLVDLECLAHPLRADEIASAGDEPMSALSCSVLRTGLLPMWQSRAAGDTLYDNSGLNGPVSRRSFLPVLHWERNNTDAMGWVHKTWHHRHRSHRPILDRRLLSITAFERDVLTGYRSAAALLEGSDGSELHPLRCEICGAAARRIKRPTLVYGLLLRQSLEPAALSEGVDRSIELMSLPCVAHDTDWQTEISCLEVLDIPYFQYAKGSKAAPSDGQEGRLATFPAHQENMVRSAIRRQVKLEEGKIVVLTKPNESPVRQRPGTITLAR